MECRIAERGLAMPKEARPGVKTLYCELPESLYEWLRKFAFDRRETKTDVVIRALGRERDDPSPLPQAPPPAPAKPKRPRGRPRKERPG
jgi:hypothetical protein